MWFFILFLSIVFILFAIMVAQAPVGYEDEDGFHYGTKFKEEDEEIYVEDFNDKMFRENNSL